MTFTPRHRARLYALTALACAIWLAQSLVEAYDDGSIWSWANIIFSLCLAVVIGYTAYNAVHGWNAPEQSGDASNQTDTPTAQRQSLSASESMDTTLASRNGDANNNSETKSR